MHGVPVDQQQIVAILFILQHTREIHAHASHAILPTKKGYAGRIRRCSEPTRAGDHVGESLRLRHQCVGAGELHFTGEYHCGLHLPVRLTQHQHVVVRRKARVTGGRGGGSRVDHIRRVERHAERNGQLTLRALLRKSRNLRLFQRGTRQQAAGLQYQIAHRHALTVRILPGTAHGAAQRDILRRAELGQREHGDLIVFLQRNGRGGGAVGTQRGTKLLARGVGPKPRDDHASQIGVGLETTGVPNRVVQRAGLVDALRAGLPHVARNRNTSANAVRHARHFHDVTGFDRNTNHGRALGGVREAHVDHDAITSLGGALHRRDDTLNANAPPRRIIRESTGRRDQLVE